jgi:hypothetical protein
MKTLYCFLLIFLSLIILLSCDKDQIRQFSCDPSIDEFVKENSLELSGIDIFELALYDIEVQRAIFRSWDHGKKREAWLEKLLFVMDNEGFTTSESSHVQDLIDHITDDYFLPADADNANSGFAAGWIDHASKELLWPGDYIAFIVFRLYTDISQLKEELSPLKSLQLKAMINSETGDCNCNTLADFCNGICYKRDCKILPSGCGWLWSMECDGNCY